MSDIEINGLDQFNNMVESSWDDIQDLPDFVKLPRGRFLVEVFKAEFGTNQDKDKGRIGLTARVVETLELFAEGAEAPVEGSLTSMSYTDTRGLQSFKKDFISVAQGLQANNPQELIQFLNQGLQIEIETAHRSDPNNIDPETDQPKLYVSWRNAQLPA